MNRPVSIVRFEKIYLLSLAISIAGMALGWDAMVEEFGDTEGAGVGVGLISIAAGLLIALVLWYFIARRASNVAKWIFVVLTAIGVVTFVMTLGAGAALDLATIVNIVSNALAVYAAWLLFQPDAAAWLTSKGRDGAVDPGTFD